MTILNHKIDMLKEYFELNHNILMAFIFGSYSRHNETSESDFDIAIYFSPEENKIEWEEEKIYPYEDIIWTDLEKITGINTDLIVLNRAPSNLAYSVIQDGIPIIIKDYAYYLRFFLCISSAAEDFRDYIADYWKIKQRSKSISEIDRIRLIKTIDFMETELKDYDLFKDITDKDYNTDAYKRRNIERWVENIINSSIDIAKILLASEGHKMPQTYRLVLNNLSDLDDFDADIGQKLSKNAKLRNILALEYLDIRFRQIKDYLIESDTIYSYLIEYTKRKL
ncbi:MAG: DUF86 domain-containing protein [Spirochaetes bacterium]|nr:DUF86 domain-containing protein [Spirochaetota bacterium]